MGKKLRVILMFVGLLLIGAIAGFLAWCANPAQPMTEALAAMQPDSEVDVNTDNDGWLVFSPVDEYPETGLIIYPGGHVDTRAYAPMARNIAAHGYLVVLVRMPLNLAVFDAGAAARVEDAYPDVLYWAVGGHSLGGAMAANFTAQYPDMLEGLVLWASYPAQDNDLSDSGLSVLSISASLDGLATSDKIEASKGNLPEDTLWMNIEGGNHAQFGWYGKQSGDHEAEITRDQQQQQILSGTLAFLAGLKGE